MNPSVCVEIGSAQGKFTCYIASALAEIGKGDLYAIDPHTTTDWNDSASVDSLPILKENLRLWGRVLKSAFRSFARPRKRPPRIGKSLLIFYCYRDHSYEGVKQDWELFSPFVKESGVIVFHDTAWHLEEGDAMAPEMGVPRFVEELRNAGYPVVTLLQNHGLSLVQPVKGGMPLYGGHSGAW